jgi:hypothetical protein
MLLDAAAITLTPGVEFKLSSHIRADDASGCAGPLTGDQYLVEPDRQPWHVATCVASRRASG